MKNQSLLRAVALGQLLAFLIAITATTSTALARQGISAPLSQSALNYLLLALTYCHLHFRRRRSLAKPWSAYALLALLDVEANFCLVLAYKFTSLTSVTLLDCFTIPVSVVLSALLLGTRFRAGHYAGAAICVAGLSLLVLTDKTGGGVIDDVWLGDGLVLLGATLYAACNVVAEKLIGDVSVQELLAMQGLFGLAWTLVQGLPLELHTLASAPWSAPAIMPFLGFGLAMFAFYSLVPFQLRWGGAALLNLSLLTSDLWTALARFVLFGGFGGKSLLFFALSFVVVAAGIVVYTRSGEVYPNAPPGGELGAEEGKLDLLEAAAAGMGTPSLSYPSGIYWQGGAEEGWHEERVPLTGSEEHPQQGGMEHAEGSHATHWAVQQQQAGEEAESAAAKQPTAAAATEAAAGNGPGRQLWQEKFVVLGRGSWDGHVQGEGPLQQASEQVWQGALLLGQQEGASNENEEQEGLLPHCGGGSGDAEHCGAPLPAVRIPPAAAREPSHLDIESPPAAGRDCGC